MNSFGATGWLDTMEVFVSFVEEHVGITASSGPQNADAREVLSHHTSHVYTRARKMRSLCILCDTLWGLRTATGCSEYWYTDTLLDVMMTGGSSPPTTARLIGTPATVWVWVFCLVVYPYSTCIPHQPSTDTLSSLLSVSIPCQSQPQTYT